MERAGEHMHAFVNAFSKVSPCRWSCVSPGRFCWDQPSGKCWMARSWSVTNMTTFIPARLVGAHAPARPRREAAEPEGPRGRRRSLEEPPAGDVPRRLFRFPPRQLPVHDAPRFVGAAEVWGSERIELGELLLPAGNPSDPGWSNAAEGRFGPRHPLGDRPAMTRAPTIALNDGRPMPRLGVGTWPMDDAEAERAVGAAIEVGYRLIDTAARYANERGVGRAVAAAAVPREELFVTTKLRGSQHGHERRWPASRRAARAWGSTTSTCT